MGSDSKAVGDLELNDYANNANTELYHIITENDDARRFVVTATKPPQVPGYSNRFQLPHDIDRLASVHVYRNGRYVPAIPADSAEMPELADNQSTLGRTQYYDRRDFNTGERFIDVFPAPTSDTLAITYWPAPQVLSLDTDSVDNSSGFAEFIELGMTIRMLHKVERDATAHMVAMRQLKKRIIEAVTASDLSGPRTIRDIAHRYPGYGGFSGW